MKNKKYLVIPVFAFLALLGAGVASAQGMGGIGWGMGRNIDPATAAQNFEDRMTEEAGIIGISIDEMKSKWSEGKSMIDIAKEKGITQEQLHEKMQTLRQEQMKQMLKNLVDQGKITQSQADSRLKFMEEQTTKDFSNGKRIGGKHGRGMMMGIGI